MAENNKNRTTNELYDLVKNGDLNPTEESVRKLRHWLNSSRNTTAGVSEQAVYQGDYKNTPLHVVLNGNLPADVVNLLIECAPETLGMKNKSGSLPLHCACNSGVSLDIIRTMVKVYPEGIKIEDNYGWLPIHFACWSTAGLDVLNFLLEVHPRSINKKDRFNRRPSDIFKRWICIKSDDSEDDETSTNYSRHRTKLLLHDAIITGFSIHLVKFLIEAFPESCTVQDDNGMIPLHYACSNVALRSMDVVAALLNVYTEGSTVRDNQGRTPLQLMKPFASVIDKNGMLPIHHQAATGSSDSFTVDSLQFLVHAYPASIMIADGHGMLPWHHACLNRNSSIDLLLLFLKLYPESIRLSVTSAPR